MENPFLANHFCILVYFRTNANRRPSNSDVYKCVLCTSYHALRFCKKFLAMDSQERNRVVRKFEYCINCLAKSHTFRKYRSRNTCHRCQHYHHTLLHTKTRLRITPPNRQHLTSPPPQRTQKIPKQSSQRNPPPPKKATPNTSPPMPDQHILSEAIKSLATVLCATQTPSSTSSRRHV